MVFFHRMIWNIENEGWTHRRYFFKVEEFIDKITSSTIGRLKLRGKHLQEVIGGTR